MPARVAWWVAGILALAGIYTCWCETPLIWDGAYQLAVMLREQRPYSFEGRFHSWILWLPIVPLSKLTSNLHLLQFVYGAPFALAPALGVILSWWIVRKEAPHLIIWPIFGIAAATLPGQIFIINDSIFQQHLFWPAFMAAFVRINRTQLAALTFLLVFQFSHAIGVVLFAGAAGAAGLMALFDRSGRAMFIRRAVLFAVLAGGVVLKFFVFPDSYAADEATWEKAVERWEKGVAGWPLRGLVMMWLSAGMVLVHAVLAGRGAHRLARGAGVIAMALAGVAGAMWVYWASDEYGWSMVIDFRRWVVPLTVPFFLGATIEACLRARERNRAIMADVPPPGLAASREGSPWDLRAPLGYLLAMTFAVVLTIQSVQWRVLSGRLMDEVRAYPHPLIPQDAFPWSDRTALQHWGTVCYAMLKQGKTPEKLIVNEEGFRLVLAPRPQIPYSWFDLRPPEPGSEGWFDHRPLVQENRERRAR